MSTGAGFWLDEMEKMPPATLSKFEKLVAREYMSRALKALTLNELKKLMLGVKKLERRRREAQS
jgi:hypothetical protein